MNAQHFFVRRPGLNVSVSLGIAFAALVTTPACSPEGMGAGTGGVGTGGGIIGSGGVVGSGGIVGSGGVVGSGGAASGGAVGSGGAASGGVTGSGGAASGGGSSGGASSGGTGSGGDGSGGGSGFQPCPAAETCRILPLGDSITEGLIANQNSSEGGYRVPLFELAIEAGKDITFVGTRGNNAIDNPPDTVAGVPFPPDHEGTSGIKIQGLLDRNNLYDDDPHIVLLHIGTNDLFQNELSGSDARLELLVDEITTALPNALVAVAKLIPLPARETQLATFNDEYVADLVAEKAAAGAHVILVDHFTGYPDGSELPDGVHPNAAGYDRMGATWYAAIESYLP